MTFQSPLSVASTVAEDFQLEYANGMPLNEVGWGHANAAIVNEMITLHTAGADLIHRTSYLARAQASNLMIHIVDTCSKQ
jgi:4-phytase/acid phosphatase